MKIIKEHFNSNVLRVEFVPIISSFKEPKLKILFFSQVTKEIIQRIAMWNHPLAEEQTSGTKDRYPYLPKSQFNSPFTLKWPLRWPFLINYWYWAIDRSQIIIYYYNNIFIIYRLIKQFCIRPATQKKLTYCERDYHEGGSLIFFWCLIQMIGLLLVLYWSFEEFITWHYEKHTFGDNKILKIVYNYCHVTTAHILEVALKKNQRYH